MIFSGNVDSGIRNKLDFAGDPDHHLNARIF